MIARGSFAALQLGGATKEVMAQFPTGRLEVTQGTARRYIWFQNRKVRSVTSKVENEHLGSWLATRGLINRRVLRDILINKPRTERLGNMLVDRGLIDRARVQQELETMAMTVAGRMVILDGKYEAESDQRLPNDALFFDDLPLALFTNAARRMPDTGNFEVAAGSGRRWAATNLAGAADLGVGLLPMEQFVLEQLANPHTLDELQALVPEQAHEVSRALVCLAAGGLAAFTEVVVNSIVVEKSTAPTPPSPAPPSIRPALANPHRQELAQGDLAQEPHRAMPPAPPPAPVLSSPPVERQVVRPIVVPAPEMAQSPKRVEPIQPTNPTPVGGASLKARPLISPPVHATDRPARKLSTPLPAANPVLRALLAEVVSAPARGKATSNDASIDAGAPLLDTRRAQVIKDKANELLASGDNPREAWRLLLRAVELEPDADSLVRLAELEAAGPLHRHHALDHLKLAVELAPRHTGAWLALANYWNVRGDPTKQRRCLDKILSYDPNNEAAKKALALLSND